MHSTDVIVVEIDEKRIRDLAVWPAVSSGTSEVYIWQGNEVIGKGRVSGTYGDRVTIEPDENAREHLKDLEIMRVLGRHAFMRFQTYDGYRYPGELDDNGNPSVPEDIFIVDARAFDHGDASEKRYGHLAGFGAKAVSSTPLKQAEGSDGRKWSSSDGKTRMYLTEGGAWFLEIENSHVDQDFDPSRLMHRNNLWLL